jgi:hypothetical protein
MATTVNNQDAHFLVIFGSLLIKFLD